MNYGQLSMPNGNDDGIEVGIDNGDDVGVENNTRKILKVIVLTRENWLKKQDRLRAQFRAK
jgi:hypothetical protein